MTDLGELPAALHLGLRATLGAVAIRGEGDVPIVSLARPLAPSPGSLVSCGRLEYGRADALFP